MNSVKIRYKDHRDKVVESTRSFDKEEYDDSMSYKENVGTLVVRLYDEGGIWINKITIIPFHRILSVTCVPSEEKKYQQPKKKGKNKFRNKNRRQKIHIEDNQKGTIVK